MFHVHLISLKREYVGCMISGRCYNASGTSCKLLEEDVLVQRQERLASYLQKMLQRSKKSLLTTQTTGCFYISPNPEKKQCAKVTTVPPLHGRPHLKHCISADPCLGQGRGGAWYHRRCGTCFFTAMALPLSKVLPLTIINNYLSVFMRFTKPQRRQPLRDSSSAGALTSHSSHSILLFKLAICPTWHLPPGPKPFKPFRRPVQGNSRTSVFKGVQACRLPGPKPFKPFRKPFQGNSRSYTPRPSIFKGVQACPLPGPKPFKPSRKPFESNSRSYTPRPSVFKGVQACRLPGP